MFPLRAKITWEFRGWRRTSMWSLRLNTGTNLGITMRWWPEKAPGTSTSFTDPVRFTMLRLDLWSRRLPITTDVVARGRNSPSRLLRQPFPSNSLWLVSGTIRFGACNFRVFGYIIFFFFFVSHENMFCLFINFQ